MSASVTEACARLDRSPMTVYRLLRAGRLRARRQGRSWRINERSLETYQDEQEAGEWKLLVAEQLLAQTVAGEFHDGRFAAAIAWGQR